MYKAITIRQFSGKVGPPPTQADGCRGLYSPDPQFLIQIIPTGNR